MKKKLPSIMDENSILITVEFLKEGEILKIGERSIERYELELIVKNDITLNQLLEAINVGLQNKLLQDYKVDLKNDSIQLTYYDIKYPVASRPGLGEGKSLSDTEYLFTLMNQNASEPEYTNSGSGTRRKARKKRKIEKNEEKLAIAERALDEKGKFYGDPEKGEEDLSKEEQKETADDIKRKGYLICWKIFHECYEKYLNEGSSLEFLTDLSLESELEAKKNPRTPIIGVGSVDYNAIKMGKKLAISDQNEICLSKGDGETTLKRLGFITTTRLIFDPIGWHHSAALFDNAQVNEAFRDGTPLYNISNRPLKKLDSESIHIIPPTDPPRKDKQNLLMTILTPLLMTGSMLASRMLMGGSGGLSMGLMTGCMGATTAIVALINVRIRNKDHKKSVEEWRSHYQIYIQHLLNDIQENQNHDIAKLHELYPPARTEYHNIGQGKDLVSKALFVDGDIFSRGQEHPDFLTVRIGQSTDESHLVPSVFQIIGEKKETVFASIRYHNIRNKTEYPFGIFLPDDKGIGKEDGSEGYLIDLPSEIAKEYEYLKGAPVLLSLKKCGTLGIVFEDKYDFYPFLSNMILDLCFYQSPDDLQCVMLCEENEDWLKQQDMVRRFKHLPHFRELLGDLSAFAFDKESAYLIFNRLLERLSERKKAEEGARYPHILVIVMQEYDLKRHPISEYLPIFHETEEKNEYGISFIFCKRHMEELPRYCGQVIKRNRVDEKHDEWFLLPHTQIVARNEEEKPVSDERRYGFVPDRFPPDRKDMGDEDHNDNYYRAFKILSALYYERIAQGADVPASLELFEIIGNSHAEQKEEMERELQDYIKAAWGMESGSAISEGVRISKNITESLAVPIGKKESGIIELDLHEKADGPHMLVAGTTGSGKTETILTFLIGLCALYTPEEVNLLLMDMKGAGFVQRIGEKENRLPHVVGTVTDITGDETGTGTVYMLKRFLQSMNAEVKRRKLLLNRMGVDSVDDYTRARADLNKHVENHPKLDIDALRKLSPLPHLFLVIDEFTELMKISSDNDGVDFQKAITSLARIGRSLGFHIILISQNIENAITPDIRVNSRARLCLKVVTRDASKEMIGTDLAASPLMPGKGRAYLLVGTGSRFEYFQSGYSGADITRNMESPVVITNAELNGEYSLFYDSEEKYEGIVSSGQASLSKKKKTGMTQLKLLVDQIRKCYEESGINEPHCVFPQPLPTACYYEYDWDLGTGNWKALKENREREDEMEG